METGLQQEDHEDDGQIQEGAYDSFLKELALENPEETWPPSDSSKVTMIEGPECGVAWDAPLVFSLQAKQESADTTKN